MSQYKSIYNLGEEAWKQLGYQNEEYEWQVIQTESLSVDQ